MEPINSSIRFLRRVGSDSLGIRLSDDPKRSPWSVLRNRSFRWYFIGSVSSDFGTWVQNTAQVLLAYRLTHSVLAVALVTCAQFSSPLVLGPWAGVMADRFGGKKTLLWTEFASAVIAGGLAFLEFTGHLDDHWLVSGAIAIGLTFTFALPARNVTVRRLVPPDKIRAAYAMDSVSYNLGRALAPPVSVAVIVTLGFGYAFALNAGSFLIFTAVLLLASKGNAEPERRSRVTDGFRIAYGEGRIMIALMMVVAVTVAADPILVLGPALARHFGASASWSGCFIAALGAGSVLGSLRRSKHAMSLRLAATLLCLLGVFMVAFVLAPFIWISIVAAFLAGATCLVANSAMRTLLASEAGPAGEASVMAVWAIAWAGSKPFASLTDGLLANAIGIHWTGVLLAMPAIIPILAIVLLPGLGHRLARSRSEQAPQPAPEPVPVG